VDQGLRVQLQAMGFEEAAVRAALRDAANDEVKALEVLTAAPPAAPPGEGIVVQTGLSREDSGFEFVTRPED